MAATPESKVKKRVREVLDKLGIYHFMPPANGFGFVVSARYLRMVSASH